MNTFKLIFLGLIIIQIGHTYAQGPECCDRHAIIKTCTADDPMNITSSMDAYCPSIRATISERLTRDCFHLLYGETVDAYRERANREGWGSIVKPSNVPDYEYTFDVDFVSGLDEYNDSGRPVRSRLSVKMYFEGEQRELVYDWNTEGTWDTVSNSGTSWLGHSFKLEKAFREAPDIIEIIERFEKRPVEFDISPDKNDINAGEIIEFELTGFNDIFGETSREFNRIVVHTFEGDILNGDVCNIGPDYRVFRLNEGSVKVKYQAPSDCDVSTDRLTVYSSCDILPIEKVPLEETQIKEQIIEKEFNINCYDAQINVRKTYNKNLSTSCRDIVNKTVENHNLTESIQASATLYLTLTETMDMPVLNQTWQYFKPSSVTVSSISYISTENKFSSSEHHQTNVDYNRIVRDQQLDGKETVKQIPWILVIDNETKKPVKLLPAGFGISYEIFESEVITSVKYDGEGGQERESETITRTYPKSFKLGPVGEDVEDPTIKTSDTWIQDYLKKQGVELPAGVSIPNISNQETIKKIHPDILVKFGDGISSFGGEGNRRIPKELECGMQEERLHYSWNMTLNKKQ